MGSRYKKTIVEIIGIDPAAQYPVGISLLRLKNNRYKILEAFEHTQNRDNPLYKRAEEIYKQLPLSGAQDEFIFIETSTFRNINTNNPFQQMLGCLQMQLRHQCSTIAAPTVKAFFKVKFNKSMTKDEKKRALAMAVKKYLDSDSKKLYTRLIKEGKWNATDAVAIGIAGYEIYKKSKD